ncbi:Isoaspartyl aminopeptidase @ Asp-X dipeptidase [hydrothermal vent metagenome]|uniref:Isoaspartyl aminopeptidase @ Asp-X dipeptidase n=1 Tax=hydrothermal vent metagenome TaxID=652676 RepID=A0A3B0R903_9ZZZZ
MSQIIALALHGGAGPIRKTDTTAEEQNLRQLLLAGETALLDGAKALDVVEQMIRGLEEAGLYIAGRGASPNRDGQFELDASIMDGAARRAGAVCALQGYVSPIAVARAVMEHTPHVMLAGQGAMDFAAAQGMDKIDNPETHFTPVTPPGAATNELSHGTVGCVALDAQGGLAAGTSTGGVLHKLPGRVGDTPLIGAGTWADKRVAVSCTGQGEYFIRAAVAADVSARMAYGGASVDAAAAGALADMQRQGGDGGLIAIDQYGRVTLPYISHGMRRAARHGDGRIEVGVFR